MRSMFSARGLFVIVRLLCRPWPRTATCTTPPSSSAGAFQRETLLVVSLAPCCGSAAARLGPVRLVLRMRLSSPPFDPVHVPLLQVHQQPHLPLPGPRAVALHHGRRHPPGAGKQLSGCGLH